MGAAAAIGAAGGWPPLLLAVQVTFLVVLTVANRLGPGVPAFVVSRGEFGVPPRWWLPAWAAVLTAYAGMPVGWIVAGPEARTFDVVTLAVFAALLVVVMWFVLRPSVVVLSQVGVVRWDLFGRVLVPWEAMAAGEQATVYRWGSRWLHLGVARGAVRRRGVVLRPRELPLRELDVDAQFLSDAIEFYVRHPERRAAIGSPEEHRRLFADLAEWYRVNRPVAPSVGR